MLTLSVTTRDAKTPSSIIRKKGLVPGVFYGPKEPATSISVDARELERAWKTAGRTSVVTLSGAGEAKESLIHDVQVHPVSGRVLHADFYVLEKGKKIEIAVPLEFKGHAPAEKTGHIIVKALHQIEIEVAPAELPHTLPVDLSTLENVGDHISAGQIPLPPSASLVTDPEETVVSVTAFVEEKEEKPIEAAAAAPAETETPAAAQAPAESAPKQ